MNHKVEKLTALSCSRYHEQLFKSAFSIHFENSFACISQLGANEDVFCCAVACCCCCSTGADSERPPKSIDEMPWPIVDPTATEPAVAAICPSRPGPEEAWACVGAEVCAGGAGAGGACVG